MSRHVVTVAVAASCCTTTMPSTTAAKDRFLTPTAHVFLNLSVSWCHMLQGYSSTETFLHMVVVSHLQQRFGLCMRIHNYRYFLTSMSGLEQAAANARRANSDRFSFSSIVPFWSFTSDFFPMDFQLFGWPYYRLCLLAHCVVCLSVVCDVLYCGKMVRLS